MVSNWTSRIRLSRWGNSKVATPSAASRIGKPATKSRMSGTWASTLLAAIRSALTPRVDEPLGGGAAEEGDFGRDAAGDRRRRDIGRRLDPERRHAGGEEMAQQIAVVGGDLDHHRARPEREAVDHRQRVAARVRDPGIRHRREIGVVGEDRLGTDRFVDLNQEALAAHARVQRKAPLASLQRPLPP